MFKKLRLLINDLVVKLVSSLKRFPEALVMALAAVTVLIYINHQVSVDDALKRAAMVLALGVPLALCIKMAFERLTVKMGTVCLVNLLAILALVGYYHFLLPDMGMVTVTRYIGVTVALYLLFMCIPFWRRKEGFSLYVIKLFINFIVTYFYSLILYLGLCAILFTINTLFTAGISEKVYLDLWFVVAGLFAPAYFFAGIPGYGSTYSMEDYPKFLRILLLYIVMPLLSVYTGILYAYFIKILATRHWPVGMVSNLVLWYSFICTAVIFFIYVLKEKNYWARIFEYYLPKVILPLMIMMFVAMGIRINAYGVTENRYLVMAGGMWSTGCMIYFALKRKSINIAPVLSAAIIAALVVSGPWSCYSVSEYSQNARFEKILSGNNMLVNGNIVPAREISNSDKVEISSIIQYFQMDHNLKELNHLPPDFKIDQMPAVFGFAMTISEVNKYFNYSIKESGDLQDIRGYDYYLSSSLPTGEKNNIQSTGPLSVSYDPETKIVEISKQGKSVYKRNVADIALKVRTANTLKDMVDPGDMSFTDENENLKVMFLFRNINGRIDEVSGQPLVENLDFSLFIKVK